MTLLRTVTAVAASALFAAALSACSEPAPAPTALEFRFGGGWSGYTVHWQDGKLSCHSWNTSHGEKTLQLPQPSEQAWHSFRAELDRLAVWAWRLSYAPDQPIMDGESWELVVRYTDAAIESSGHNEYPDLNGQASRSADPSAAFLQLAAAVDKIAVGCRP